MPLNSYFGEFNFHHMPFALLPYHHVTTSPLASIMATTTTTSHHQSQPRPPPPWCIQMHQVGFFFPFFSFTNPGQCLHIDCVYGHRDLHHHPPPPYTKTATNTTKKVAATAGMVAATAGVAGARDTLRKRAQGLLMNTPLPFFQYHLLSPSPFLP